MFRGSPAARNPSSALAKGSLASTQLYLSENRRARSRRACGSSCVAAHRQHPKRMSMPHLPIPVPIVWYYGRKTCKLLAIPCLRRAVLFEGAPTGQGRTPSAISGQLSEGGAGDVVRFAPPAGLVRARLGSLTPCGPCAVTDRTSTRKSYGAQFVARRSFTCAAR